MNTYNAYYKGKQTEVEANTSYEAQRLAAQWFKAKKAYDVTVVLVAKDGEVVKHDPGSL